MNRASSSSCFLGSKIEGCVPGAEFDDVGGAGGCWRLSIAANITGDNINRPLFSCGRVSWRLLKLSRSAHKSTAREGKRERERRVSKRWYNGKLGSGAAKRKPQSISHSINSSNKQNQAVQSDSILGCSHLLLLLLLMQLILTH